ncbi:MFS transporter [Alsobacter sp. R-9]
MTTIRTPADGASGPVSLTTMGGVSPRGGLAALASATLLASLGTSSANVTLPFVAETLSASFDAVQWVVLSYLVAMTALAVTVGRIADVIGQRRVLVVGLLVFSGASLVCASAPGLGALVAARAVQGAGSAAMIAVSLAMVPRIAAQDRMGTAMGLMGTMSAIGTALGPAAGGLLIGLLGWRGVFLANVPFGLTAALAAWALLPVSRAGAASSASRFDWRGSLLLTAALTAYALAMTSGRGASMWVTVGLTAAAVVATLGLVRVERIAPSPVVPMATLSKGLFRAGYIASAVVSSVMMATLVIGPFYLSAVLDLDPAGTGLAMACGPVASALAGVPAGRMVDRFGGRRAALGGLVTMLLAAILLMVIPDQFGVAGYIVPLMVLTTGYALFQAANNTVIMSAAGLEARGSVSGMLSLSRNLGLITGAALLGAVFSAFAGGPGSGQMLPASAITGTHAVFAASSLVLAMALVVVHFADRTDSIGSACDAKQHH